MPATRRWLVALMLAFACLATPARAADRLIAVASRPGVTIGYWWMPRDGAITVLLMSGGSGGIGLRDGVPRSSNFLIRSRDAFAQAGFNVALMGNASDMRALNPDSRIAPAHVDDIRAIVADIRRRQGGAIWLVGTSQGTISATAAAIAMGSGIDGLVLSASVTDRGWSRGAVPNQDLDEVLVPVLVHHDKKDECRRTRPDQAEAMVGKFTHAPFRKFIELDGGQNPSGDPCEALHYHGYVGVEDQAVKQMVDWIKKPSP
jgi:pimeloyl-ACP methyl ester carboxylesterase